MFGLKRAASGLWSARLSIPRDRWQDVGLAYGTKSGIRQEFLKSLQTHDKQEAIRRRGPALEALRSQVNEKLAAIGKPLLEGEWKALSVVERAVADALSAKEEIEKASTAYSPAKNADGSVDEYVPTTDQEHLRDVATGRAVDVAESLPDAKGQLYLTTFTDTLDGTATPLGPLLDRWERERDRTVSKASRAMDVAAFNHFAGYLAEYDKRQQGSAVKEPMRHLRAKGLESLELRVLGGFTEWLLDSAGLTAKTVGSRVSPLKMFWEWCIRKHIISGPNPWTGATRGLKQQAARQGVGKPKRWEFSEGELLALLRADPDEGRRWTWGQAIRDLMPLALLTGARENELCSLTADRVVQLPGADLLGIAVLEEDAKTVSSIRRVPLHPLVRPIIERRLAAAIATGEPDAPLFPECKPGGPAEKRGYYFSKRFTEFRRDVLEAGSDGLVTFHSFRKCFGTFMRRAAVAGVSECQLAVAQKLMGHKPQTITETTYMEAEMPWSVYEAAILGMVDKGMPESVREALT